MISCIICSNFYCFIIPDCSVAFTISIRATEICLVKLFTLHALLYRALINHLLIHYCGCFIRCILLSKMKSEWSAFRFRLFTHMSLNVNFKIIIQIYYFLIVVFIISSPQIHTYFN